MDELKRKKLEEAGWQVGSAEDFLYPFPTFDPDGDDEPPKIWTNKPRELILILREIKDLASWHYDPDADSLNTSPEDNVAHINGLIVKLCNEGLTTT